MRKFVFIVFALLAIIAIVEAKKSDYKACLLACLEKDPLECFHKCKNTQNIEAPLGDTQQTSSVSGYPSSMPSFMSYILSAFPLYFTSMISIDCSSLSSYFHSLSSRFISGYIPPSKFSRYTELRFWNNHGCAESSGNSISHRVYYENNACIPVANSCLYKKFTACNSTVGTLYSYCLDSACQDCIPVPLWVGPCLDQVSLACVDAIPSDVKANIALQLQSSCLPNAKQFDTLYLDTKNCLTSLRDLPYYSIKEHVECQQDVAVISYIQSRYPYYNCTNGIPIGQDSISSGGCLGNSPICGIKYTCPGHNLNKEEHDKK